jgi:hypothetical protein
MNEYNHKEMQEKYVKKSKNIEQKLLESGKLVIYDNQKINPKVVEFCKQIDKDYITHYNTNRYFCISK